QFNSSKLECTTSNRSHFLGPSCLRSSLLRIFLLPPTISRLTADVWSVTKVRINSLVSQRTWEE
ncbi:hypothetical protein T439DRAFT_313663, partial [Meredithblackwellia eburnea MCA 4105]